MSSPVQSFVHLSKVMLYKSKKKKQSIDIVIHVTNIKDTCRNLLQLLVHCCLPMGGGGQRVDNTCGCNFITSSFGIISKVTTAYMQNRPAFAKYDVFPHQLNSQM